MKTISWIVGLAIPCSLAACSAADVGRSQAAGSGGAQGTGGGTTASGGQSGDSLLPITVAEGGTDCGRKKFDLGYKAAGVLLVLDQSSSMQDPSSSGPSKWSMVVPAVQQVLQATDGALAWGLKLFPELGTECGPETVTTKIDVPIGRLQAANVIAAIPAQPPGNGTPTGPIIKTAAMPYLQSINDGLAKYIVLATDGEPSCAYGPTKDTTQARLDAVGAVSQAAQAGFHTFVIGVDTTKANDTATLNQLAIAGGEPAPSVNPLDNKFFLASTAEQLIADLKMITGVIATCVFNLDGAPPVPENIGVKVNGELAPRDKTHLDGWDYASPDYASVQVYGSWCNKIQAVQTQTNNVEFIFACMGDVIK